jgi:hypothetical protein
VATVVLVVASVLDEVVVVTLVVVVGSVVVLLVPSVVVVEGVVVTVVLLVPPSVVEVVGHGGGSQASAQLVKAWHSLPGGRTSKHFAAVLATQPSPFWPDVRQSTNPGRPQREFTSARFTYFTQPLGNSVLPSSFATRFKTGRQQRLYRPALAIPSHMHSASIVARTCATIAGSGHPESASHMNAAPALATVPRTPASAAKAKASAVRGRAGAMRLPTTTALAISPCRMLAGR